MTKFPFYPPDRASAYERFAAEYAFDQTEPTPWTPLRRELRKCRVALVISGGLRLPTQHEFPREGSAEFRRLSLHLNPEELAIDNTDYDHGEVEADLNVLAPVDRLKEMVDAETIGGVHEIFYSFFGPCPDREALTRSARQVGEELRTADTDAVLLVPAGHLCIEPMGIIARALERAGLSTVAVTTMKEVTAQIRVPRAIAVHFPFGRTLGRAGDRETQHAVLEGALRALRTLERPGHIVDLTLRWEGMVE